MMLVLIRKYFRRSINVLLWINLILFAGSSFVFGFMFVFNIAGDNLIVCIAGGCIGGMIGQIIGACCGLLINLLFGGIIVTFLELGNDISIIRAKTVSDEVITNDNS